MACQQQGSGSQSGECSTGKRRGDRDDPAVAVVEVMGPQAAMRAADRTPAGQCRCRKALCPVLHCIAKRARGQFLDRDDSFVLVALPHVCR